MATGWVPSRVARSTWPPVGSGSWCGIARGAAGRSVCWAGGRDVRSTRTHARTRTAVLMNAAVVFFPMNLVQFCPQDERRPKKEGASSRPCPVRGLATPHTNISERSAPRGASFAEPFVCFGKCQFRTRRLLRKRKSVLSCLPSRYETPFSGWPIDRNAAHPFCVPTGDSLTFAPARKHIVSIFSLCECERGVSRLPATLATRWF